MHSYEITLRKIGIMFLIFLLVFTGMGVNLGASVSYAATEGIYVSSDGNNSTGDGTRANPYATLNKAYQEVPDGGTIYVLKDITQTTKDGQMLSLGSDKRVTITTAPEVETVTIKRGEPSGNNSTDSQFNLTEGELTLKNIIIDSNYNEQRISGRIINVFNGSKLIIEEGVILRGSYSSFNGGVIHIQHAGSVVEMKGGEISGNNSNGAAVLVDAETQFIMSGGLITDNIGGGVGFRGTNGGQFLLSGEASIMGNRDNLGQALNVNMANYRTLILNGNLTGEVGITSSSMTPGAQFGQAAEAGLTGLENLFADNNPHLIAVYGDGNTLEWQIDKSSLQSRVDTINGENLIESKYTEESWQALQEALQDAQNVLNKRTATLAEVNAALEALNAAYAALVSGPVYVSSGGNDSTGDGTRDNPYATIQKASQEVRDEGTIYILDDITLSGGVEVVARITDKHFTISTAPDVAETAVIKRGDPSGKVLFQLENNSHVTLRNIIIDGNLERGSLDGRLFNVYTGSTLTIDEGAILQNSYSWHLGSAIFVNNPGSVVEMKGGEISGNKRRDSGGAGAAVLVDSGAQFMMTGGRITNNTDGGVQSRGGQILLSGDAVITGNTHGTSERNVYLQDAHLLTLNGNFTGEAGITAQNRMTPGSQFGQATDGNLTGLENLIADNHPHLFAVYGDGNALVWQTDKSPLQAKVDEINGEGLIESEYTEESWKALQDALNEAQAVLVKSNATPEEVTVALTNLEAARNHLQAVTPVTPIAPGGVRDGLLSWVDVGRSAVIADGNVTFLDDLAVDEQWRRVDPATSIPYNANSVNFNPGIRITPDSAYFVKPGVGSTSDTEREMFSVQASDNYAGFPWDLGGTGYNKPGASAYGLNNGQQIRTYFGSTVNKTIDVQGFELKNSRVMNIWSSTEDGWSFSLDGNELYTEASDVNEVNFNYSAGPYIGAGHYSRFNGSISEVIVFNKKLDEPDRIKVNSYLALKYGLTLPTDYVDSHDTTMWTVADNTEYGNRITGIGRDNDGALYQKQSMSQEVGANVTIALGNSVASSNEENLNTIWNDQSYFLFGDNGAGTNFIDPADKSDENLKRMERVYKVKKTNWQDVNPDTNEDTTITLKIDKVDGATDWPLYVVLSDDETFDADDSFYRIENGEVTIDTKDFASISYFTIAASVPELVNATLKKSDADETHIVLTFDQEIDLSDVSGFTVTIDGTEVGITAFEVDSLDKTKLILILPDGTDVTDKAVDVDYDGNRTLKGTNGVPIDPFNQTVDHQFVTGPAVPGGSNVQPVLWLKADEGVAHDGRLLTGWADRSPAPVNFSLDVPAGQEARTPTYNANGVNFNPSITFDNPAKYKHYNESAKLVGDKQLTFQSGYAVYKSPSSGHSGVLVGSSVNPGGNNGVIILGGWENDFATGNGHQNLYTYVPTVDRTRHQLTGFEIITNTNHVGRVDGKNSTVNRRGNFGPITFSPVIGATNGGTQDWTGLRADVAEIILYDNLTSAEAAKIETYLAVKYGITLNEGNSPYVATNDEIVWEVDGTYKHNIAGIGRDDAQNLNQKQSHSIHPDVPQIAIGLGIVAETNAQNSNEFTSDGQYLIWSDNGEDLVFDVHVKDTEYHPQRIWKVQNSKDVGTVQVAIPADALLDGKKLLVSDNDTDFSNATEYALAVNEINGISYYVAEDVTLEDGQYFTFSVVAPELATASVEDVNVNEQEIILTFDKPITLTDLSGLTVTIGDETLTIDSYEIDPDDNKTLRLKPEKEIKVSDTVLVSYTKENGNLKGLNGASIDDFEMEAVNKIGATPLPAPTVTLTDDVLTWGPINDAEKYEATIELEDGTTRTVEVTDPTLDLSSLEPPLAPGTYKVNVVAKSNNPNYTTSAPSNEVSYVVIDKTALQNRTSEINNEIADDSLLEEDYSPVTWQALQDALDEAQKVLNDPDATQQEVNDALKALNDAYGALEKVPSPVVNKTALQNRADEINNEIADDSLLEEDYSPVTWQALQDALDEAQKVLNDPDATQQEVNDALKALNDAYGALEKVPSPVVNKTALQNRADEINNEIADDSLLEEDYSPVTWQALQDALDEAQKVLDDPDATQQEVNDALEALDNARGALKKVTEPGLTLGSLIPSVGTLSPAFDPEKDSYSLNVANTVSQLKLTPTVEVQNAKIEIRVNNGGWQEVSSGQPSENLSLNVGTNTIIVKVTDENGTSREYTVTVTRAPGNSGGNGGGGSGGSGGSGGNGGGQSPTPPAPDNGSGSEDIISTVDGMEDPFASAKKNELEDSTEITVNIDQDKLSDLLDEEDGQKLAIHIREEGNVNVQGLTLEDLKKLADTNSSLEIEDLLAVYPVPVDQLNVDDIAQQFNDVPLGDIDVHIQIKRSAEELAQLASETATGNGQELLVHPVEIELSFSHDGQTNKAGQLDGYAAKLIALPEGIDPNRITTGVIVNPDGSLFHVPTVVTEINNRYFAEIHDLRNSGIYSVIWNPKDFNDIKTHWVNTSANDMGARLVIEGTGNNNFTPNRNITRSEFAVIAVKGLGLMRQDVEQNVFDDVPSSAWYHDAVTIANDFGIVLGHDNGAFHGHSNITREQGMTMIARSLTLIRPEAAMNEGQINQVLATYDDANQVAPWAREAVALLISEGIIEGKSDQFLKPKDTMTRAEAAAMVQRLLKTTELID
ncbi:S-layer homology domain-containing protein [Alkalihalobacillus oceani]|uniref:S-layer homology domain-containing protein n=1 Tax=Halalkalibacter oceani TaxID=1653776 RepID=UPI0020416984|nr:S-layer homology domain-containing protein [Halalkalibacter oceani]MCM3759949.1 S-layer homology domain-containing protein [Halalkalibacter oceani]